MGTYVAATDYSWFEFLSAREGLDEVNFWMPRPWGGRFRVLNPGEPLLFKLKSPYNAIAGGGVFEHYTELSLSLAWELFGERNGAPSLIDLEARISRLRKNSAGQSGGQVIGCILLSDPFFLTPEQWAPEPADWSREIVRGKRYDVPSTTEDLAIELIQRWTRSQPTADFAAASQHWGGYGNPVLHHPRLGQGIFRVLVMDAYDRRCAVTRERTLPTLEAAHIKPFTDTRTHDIRNGLLLRSDIHRLFDLGYITITPDYRVETSSRLRQDFEASDTYLNLHGVSIAVPAMPDLQPDPHALRWHNENRFRG